MTKKKHGRGWTQLQGRTQIPCGNDRQKSKGNGKGKNGGLVMGDTSYQVKGTVEMVRPVEAANWTGMDLLPFETVAERFLDLEHEGHMATLTVSFGKPFVVEGRGWACPYRIAALGREHVTPAGGADSVHALQMAMHMVHEELSGMARHHTISFLGTSDFGFGRVGGNGVSAAGKCPVVGMSVSS